MLPWRITRAEATLDRSDPLQEGPVVTEQTADTTDPRARPDADGIRQMGTRVGHAASTALTQTAFAAVGLSAYAVDLVRSLRVTPEAARTAGDWTVHSAAIAGEQIARGFRTLSLRGHRVLGVAPGVRRPQGEAAEASASVARGAAGAMLDAAAATEDAADRMEPDPYDDVTTTDLRERARDADIAGRSSMSRQELIDALRSYES